MTGLVVQEHCQKPSHWASVRTLSRWMADQGVPGIEGVDTRALVTTIRERGVMMCALANGPQVANRGELKRLLEKAARYDSVDYVRRVSVSEPETYGVSEKRVAVIDCGVKESIIRNMLGRGYSVVRMPFDSSYSDVMKHDPAGVIVSNGPGTPVSASRRSRRRRGWSTPRSRCWGYASGSRCLGCRRGPRLTS